MKVGHPYQRNGMGAIDENGQVPCGVCGHGPGAHADPREHVVPRYMPGEQYERAYDLASLRGHQLIELRARLAAAEAESERLRAIERAAWAYALDDTPAIDHFKRLEDLAAALRGATP